jgi:plastocyanin
MNTSGRAAALGGLVLITTAVIALGCRQTDDSPEDVAITASLQGSVLELTALPSGGGAFRFGTSRLVADAGSVTIRLRNQDTFPHNVRVHTGSRCCFEPGYRDVGGTETITGGARAEITISLQPGRYIFLCSIAGHFDGDGGEMRGRITVRPD